MARSDGAHECPAPDCAALLPRRMLMCRRHWFMVPEPIRDKVNSTWRAYSRNVGSFEAYMVARTEAVESVTP